MVRKHENRFLHKTQDTKVIHFLKEREENWKGFSCDAGKKQTLLPRERSQADEFSRDEWKRERESLRNGLKWSRATDHEKET